MENNEKIGVVLMTYGSATTAEHVAPYLNSIYKNKASDVLIKDFENRYRLIGHSPLIEITEKQATLLEVQLGSRYVVRAGMRHSEPSIKNAVRSCRTMGSSRIVGFILSPQYSSFIMEGYGTELTEAALKEGFLNEEVYVRGEWSTEEQFIELLSNRTKETLHGLEQQYKERISVIFTTHSLPRRVVENDPAYLRQIEATITSVVAHIDDPSLKWCAGYQSAGHTREEWLTPDLTDILRDMAMKHTKAVLIVPVQFLSDHLEILYDLDIVAREQCQEYGIAYNRIDLPNTDPLFVSALKTIVLETERSMV